jgi:hypothetical protein
MRRPYAVNKYLIFLLHPGANNLHHTGNAAQQALRKGIHGSCP